MSHSDAKITVLIVSDDPIAAALLGGLVETFGYRVTFARIVSANDALRRARPRVCMLDCESEGCDESAIARAIMRGISVVLVGPRSLLEGMRDVALRHGAGLVFTPPQPGPLAAALERAVRRPSV